MITIYTGLPGSGKTTKCSQEILKILFRNKKWFSKFGILRKVYSNVKFKPDIEQQFSDFIFYWSDPRELILIKEADIFIDEVANYFDSQNWELLPMAVKSWLRLHEHYGIDIYANTQDYSTIDISFRRLTSSLYRIKKIIGSRRPAKTKPPVKYIWGLAVINELDARAFDEKTQDTSSIGFPSFMFYTKDKTDNVFDTLADVALGDLPPLRHMVRKCESCDYERVYHK